VVVFHTLYSRRNVLQGLLIVGVATAVCPTSIGAERSLLQGTEQNLLRNGSFEMNVMGSAVTGWTITELQPEVNA